MLTLNIDKLFVILLAVKRYKIRIEGRNHWVQVERQARKLGFFTTRYIRAKTVPDATQKALLSVQEEIQRMSSVLNHSSDPPTVSIVEVTEVGLLDWLREPGARTGFTWYPEEDGEGVLH